MAELNEHHRGEVLSYMRFAQSKRLLRLKSVASCFQDVRESRLVEDTYTAEEVAELLSGLQAVVQSELELELINSAHTNVLLLQQLFSQAQHWHLRLHTDISELENRQLLEQVAELEKSQELGPSAKGPQANKPRLVPLSEGGSSSDLLHSQITRLQEENDKLRSRLRTLEGQATAALDDKRSAEQTLKDLKIQFQAKQNSQASQEVSHLEDTMTNLKLEFQKTLGDHTSSQKNLEENLTKTKHELLRVNEQLTMAEKELDKKFQETGAYRNMKDILTRKNEQIKDLRRRLSKYEAED
ncbi:LOW QUALITY PROTEIN: leucine zipper transcription factor-like protein 1 [Bufo gargarizans]|uniref:LOW QUALITY PROTEIN: leucine zipper transcription factor-like protein 1 n=1 Tax=Bufo gargarizans TaxID=30331 RepID=UPI001CF44E33|nr:LOW QUALITY PROTEIN: leucine zipper transcription factor-like protein 1 [Bufo gargarizans]